MESGLLAQAVEAHGGLARWEALEKLVIHIRVRSNILLSKFQSPAQRALTLEVNPRQPKMTLRPFPQPGQTGIFDGFSVAVKTDATGATQSRRMPFGSNRAIQRRRVWDQLDVLFFFGFAFWNYVVTPYLFLQDGFHTEEIAPWADERGTRFRRLKVVYPEAIPAHCPEQALYFDRQGLLTRLDYTSLIFGPHAIGAHYCFNPISFDGLVFPTHRVVYGRLPNNHPFTPVHVMEGWIDRVTPVYST